MDKSYSDLLFDLRTEMRRSVRSDPEYQERLAEVVLDTLTAMLEKLSAQLDSV